MRNADQGWWLSWVLGVMALLSAPSISRAYFHFPLPPNYTAVSSGKRNHIFSVGEAIGFTLDRAATRYEVRDYYGTMVASGTTTSAGLQIGLPSVTAPGWYKLYLYGESDQGSPWGKIVGGTHFVIFRNSPNFPPRPGNANAVGAADIAGDEIVRGLTGLGPQRHKVDDASKPTEAIAKLEQDIALDEVYYTPFDPIRQRRLLIAFPNGVSTVVNNLRVVDPVKIAGVKQIAAHFKDRVLYWEGKNEPNGDRSIADAVNTEQAPFYDAVKSVSPALKVLGPAVVSVKNNTLPFLRGFLALARNKLDIFSFHAYNMVNGDLALARASLDDVQSLLEEFGLGDIERWQTEQGSFAALYGSYQPRLQGRWTMLQMMTFEQYGIPKEHNHVWYDKSHGFWEIPTFCVNDDGSLNPAAPLMRVWSEELYGTIYTRAFSFGAEEKMYLGSLFAGPGKTVAAFQSAGSPYGSVTLAISSGTSVKVVSPFGAESNLSITNGRVQLPVSELPVYVELATGQTCEVVPRTLGENVARHAGVNFTYNGASDPLLARTVNGKLENLYHTFDTADAAWKVYPTAWPATVEVQLPQTETISDVVIYAAVPWQAFSTLIDYSLQYWNGTAWVTLEHVAEPTKTYSVYSPPVRCVLETFFSDRCIFEHHFAPVTTNKLRLVVNAATYGNGPTADVVKIGGQAEDKMSLNIREIEIFRAVGTEPVITTQPEGVSAALGQSSVLSVTVNTSDFSAQYVWKRNGVVLAGATTSTLHLPSLTLDDQGLYEVTVTTSAGSVTSTPVRVVVQTPVNTWAAKYFTAAQMDNPRSLLAAPSGSSGLTNLQSYYFGLDPRDPLSPAEAAGLPTLAQETVADTRYLTLYWQSNVSAPEVQWSLEGTPSLSPPSWEPVTPASVEIDTVNATTGRVPVKARLQESTLAAKFWRIRLTIP